MVEALGDSRSLADFTYGLESIPERLDLEDLVAIYHQDLTDFRGGKRLDLPFSRDLLSEAAADALVGLSQDFHSMEGVTDGRGGLFAPVRLVSIDSPRGNFYLLVEKTVDKRGGVDFGVSVFSSDDDVKSMNPIELYSETVASAREDRDFLNCKMRLCPGRILMFHRLVDSRYRGNGLGGLMLSIAEQFVQQEAHNFGREFSLVVDLCQLDVLCWLWNNGFRPVGPMDRQRLYAVLRADSNLRLIQDLAVWEGRDYIGWDGKENFVISNDYTLNMEKKFSPVR